MGVSGGRKGRGMLSLGERRATDPRRQMLADFCKLLGSRLTGQLPAPAGGKVLNGAVADGTSNGATRHDPLAGIHLSRRERQILDCLLGGDSEKQIALKLTISPHTVHTYVKRLHKALDVNSRGELLARFVR